MSQAVLEGHMTPIWFGSAINSFGVKELMDGIGTYGPNPKFKPHRSRKSHQKRKKSQGLFSRFKQTWTRNIVTGSHLSVWLRDISNADEIAARQIQKTDGRFKPCSVFGLRSRAGRRSMGRRYHRHPEPRPIADRRYIDRRRSHPRDRHSVVRA